MDYIQPKFMPPHWVFKCVWPILYLTLFVSFYYYMRGETTSLGIVAFFLQLLFNLVWYPIMFMARKPVLALLDLFFILVFLTLMIAVWPPPLNFINLPYLLWCTFAFSLNAQIAWYSR